MRFSLVAVLDLERVADYNSPYTSFTFDILRCLAKEVAGMAVRDMRPRLTAHHQDNREGKLIQKFTGVFLFALLR
jgi:hypothetical protein